MERPIIAAAAMRSSLSPLLPGGAARFSLVAAAATQKPVADAVAAAAWSGGAAEKGQHALCGWEAFRDRLILLPSGGAAAFASVPTD